MRRSLLVIPLLVVLTACGDAKDKEQRYIDSGKALLAEGNLEKAKVEFGNALQINPKSAEARYQVALIAEKQGNYNAYFKLLQLVITEKPDHAEAHAKLGLIFLVDKNLAKAREHAETAARLAPASPAVLMLQGTIALVEKDYTTAAARANALLAAAPGDAEGAALLARAQFGAGDLKAALATLDQAIARHPETAVLHLAKVQMLLAANRADDAIAAYRALITADPTNYGHRQNLAALCLRTGRQAEAQAVLREAIAAGVGGNQPKLQLVALLAEQNGLDAARAELLTLIAADPKSLALRLRLGQLDLAGGKSAEGEETLRRIIADDPDGPHGIAARLALARYDLARGQRGKAETLAAEILEREPRNPDALLMRAEFAIDKGDPNAAIVDLRTILRDNPASKPAVNLLAQAYVRAGTPLLAEDVLRRAADLDPNDPVLKQRLALVKALGGDTQAGIALLDEVTKQNPDSKSAALSLQAKVGLLFAQQRWEEAQETLRQLAEQPGWKPRALVLTGFMNLSRGQPDAAVASFEQAYELNPDNLEPVNALVRLQLSRGKAAEAAAFLQRAIKRSPDNPEYFNYLGEVEVERRDVAAAEAAFERAKTLRPNWPLPYIQLARLFTDQAEPLKALAVIEAGLQQTPNIPILLSARGEAELLLGRNDAAIATFLKVTEVEPENLSAANNAASLISDYRYADAALLKRAVELAGRLETFDDPTVQDTVGWVFYRAGDLPRARTALAKAAAALPDNPVVQSHYGLVLAKLGENAAARQALQTALKSTAAFAGRGEAEAALAALAR